MSDRLRTQRLDGSENEYPFVESLDQNAEWDRRVDRFHLNVDYPRIERGEQKEKSR